jgi:hypothetical protein
LFQLKKPNVTVDEYREVLALRAKLIALRALPVKCFLDGIPEDVAVNVETVCAFYTLNSINF